MNGADLVCIGRRIEVLADLTRTVPGEWTLHTADDGDRMVAHVTHQNTCRIEILHVARLADGDGRREEVDNWSEAGILDSRAVQPTRDRHTAFLAGGQKLASLLIREHARNRRIAAQRQARTANDNEENPRE